MPLLQPLCSQRAYLPICIPWQSCHRGVPSIRAPQQSHYTWTLLESHVWRDPRNKDQAENSQNWSFPKIAPTVFNNQPSQPVNIPSHSQPLTKTAVGPGHGCSSCRASMGTMGLCHTWGPSLGAGDPRSPALPNYRDKDQPVPRCQSDAVLEGAWPRLSSGTAVASWSQESQPQ